MIMITICISEAELLNILLVINRVCVYMHIHVHRVVCLHVQCLYLGVTFTVTVVPVACTAFLPLPVSMQSVCRGTELRGEKFSRQRK